MRSRIPVGILLVGFSLGCGSPDSSPSAPTPAPNPSAPGAVSIVLGSSALTTIAYAPNPVTIAAGGTVTWTNNDTVTHTSTSNNGVWDSGIIQPGGTFGRVFPTAGSFPYHCTLHPGMVGTVTVQ